MLAAFPGQTLWTDPFRSGIGRFSKRADLAALCSVLVFGAFANAAGMIEPVVKWQDQLSEQLGNPPRLLVTTAMLLRGNHAACRLASRERLPRYEPPLGQASRQLAGGRDAIFVRARADWLRHVARPLQFSPIHKLRHDRPGNAAFRRGPRVELPWQRRSCSARAAASLQTGFRTWKS